MDITVDPRESSFYKAMQLCEGCARTTPQVLKVCSAAVVLILDPHGVPFTRSWCWCSSHTRLDAGADWFVQFRAEHDCA